MEYGTRLSKNRNCLETLNFRFGLNKLPGLDLEKLMVLLLNGPKTLVGGQFFQTFEKLKRENRDIYEC